MSMAERFLAFDRRHPEIFRQFVLIALELIRRGYRRYSADAVLHRVRFDNPVEVNNDWVPFYARKFRALHPQYEWFFQFRHSPRADPPRGGGGPPGQGRLFDDD